MDWVLGNVWCGAIKAWIGGIVRLGICWFIWRWVFVARPLSVYMLFSVGSLWRGVLGCLHMANSFGEVALAIALAILFL